MFNFSTNLLQWRCTFKKSWYTIPRRLALNYIIIYIKPCNLIWILMNIAHTLMIWHKLINVNTKQWVTISSTHSFHQVNIDKLSSSWQAHPNWISLILNYYHSYPPQDSNEQEWMDQVGLLMANRWLIGREWRGIRSWDLISEKLQPRLCLDIFFSFPSSVYNVMNVTNVTFLLFPSIRASWLGWIV